MNQMKLTGIVLLVLCTVCLFVAVERYQANANTVRTINQMGGGMFQAMTGGNELKPSTPAATKYGLLGALIFGAGGGYCLLNSSKQNKSGT